MAEFNPTQQLNDARRVEFDGVHLFDFGNDVSLMFHAGDRAKNPGDTIVLAMTRSQVQKLFDQLWAYWFRPTE